MAAAIAEARSRCGAASFEVFGIDLPTSAECKGIDAIILYWESRADNCWLDRGALSKTPAAALLAVAYRSANIWAHAPPEFKRWPS